MELFGGFVASWPGRANNGSGGGKKKQKQDWGKGRRDAGQDLKREKNAGDSPNSQVKLGESSRSVEWGEVLSSKP